METTSPHEFTGTSRLYVERKLGAGGMGIVYLATDRDSGQQVAIKTLKAVDPTAIFKFKQEFRQLAELVHPHLIRMHELICHNSQWFFVMELIEGAVEFQEYLIASDFHEDHQTAERNLPGIHDQLEAVTISKSPVATSNPSNIHALHSSPQPGQQVDVAHGSKAQAPTSLPSGKTVESSIKTVAMDDADTTSQSISSPSLESVQARKLPKTEPEINAELDATILRVDATTAKDEMAPSHAEVAQTIPRSAELPTDLAGVQTVDQVFSDPLVDQTILGKTALPSSSSVTNAAPTATPGVRSRMPIRNMARLRDAFRQLVSGVRGLHRAGMLRSRGLQGSTSLGVSRPARSTFACSG